MKKVANKETEKAAAAEIENVTSDTNTISLMPFSNREKRQMGLA